MKVKQLIEELSRQNQDARVWMGYDGNVVVTEPDSVEAVLTDREIGDCWLYVKPGDVVILCDEGDREPFTNTTEIGGGYVAAEMTRASMEF